MKVKKQIAFVTVLVLLLNLFSPYTILFNNISNAAATGTITDQDQPIVLNATEIVTKGTNKVLKVQLAYVTEEPIFGCDVHFKIDTTKIKPCNKLNGTTVNNNDTFSFCQTTGPSTAEEGYKEATVFLDGKKVQALGGGNCQISSTLYNAVLSVPDLKVIERHEHGRDVSYVPDGKDAAVSYGSIDFKFKNNTGKEIKLYFSTDDITLNVRIVKLI